MKVLAKIMELVTTLKLITLVDAHQSLKGKTVKVC